MPDRHGAERLVVEFQGQQKTIPWSDLPDGISQLELTSNADGSFNTTPVVLHNATCNKGKKTNEPDKDSERNCQDEESGLISGTKLGVKDCLRIALMNQYAGSLRAVGASIVDETVQKRLNELQQERIEKLRRERTEEEGIVNPKSPNDTPRYWFVEDEVPDSTLKCGRTAVPLHGEKAKYLNEGAQRNPSPMSALNTDVRLVALFEDFERRGFKRNPGGLFQIDLPHDCNASDKSQQDDGVTPCNETHEVMETEEDDQDDTVPLHILADKNKMVKEERVKHLRKVHYDSLFSCIILRVLGRERVYRHFCHRANLENGIPKPDQLELFLEMLNVDFDDGTGQQTLSPLILDVEKRQFRDKSSEILQMMENIIHSNVPETTWQTKKDKLKWLAVGMVGDLYEVFDEPFGPMKLDDMIDGWGSEQAFRMFQNKNKFVSMNKKKQYNFHAALKAVINEVKQLPDDILQVLTLYKDSNGTIRSLLNGVEFGPRHAEHYLCKSYVQVKQTWRPYRRTEKKAALKPFCWPRVWSAEDEKEITDVMKEVMGLFKNTVEKHNTIISEKNGDLYEWLEVPDVITLRDETISY